MAESRLYILMRSDMDSMNPGKAMAQAAHAANLFQKEAGDEANAGGLYHDWFTQTSQGFGTTITLEIDGEKKLAEMIQSAQEYGYLAGVVHDPTYPVRDGAATHLIPVNTCGFIFVRDANQMPPYLSLLQLHP